MKSADIIYNITFHTRFGIGNCLTGLESTVVLRLAAEKSQLFMKQTTVNFEEPWDKADFIVLDLEGTGAQHKEKEGIVELATVRVHSGQIGQSTFNTRLNPGIPIPPQITRIHGISNDDVKDCPALEEMLPTLMPMLDAKILVAHNACVDWRVLNYRIPNLNPAAVLDTLKLSRALHPGLPKHSLEAMLKYLELESRLHELLQSVSLKHHSALFDATATALVFTTILRRIEPKPTVQQVFDICSLERGRASKKDEGGLIQPNLWG
jgi:DNA polymerase-3 subunit epsilon